MIGELESLRLSKNTIVIYMADHGDFVGYHGKVEQAAIGHNVYEDMIRVPLVLR